MGHPRHPFVHEWFRATAERAPDRIAIDGPHGCVSFRELRRRADTLARALTDAGAARGDVVLLCVEDRTALVIGMIAVLDARCAFVPMPPHLPPRTMAAMLDGCDPQWAIVDTSQRARFETLWPATATSIDAGSVAPQLMLQRLSPAVSPMPPSEHVTDERGTSASQPDDLSYIFFTSGSTGTPKAIAGRLRAIDHFIRWEIDTFALDDQARVSQLIAPTFDACLRDIFVPLCAGGTLCVPDDRDLILEPARLITWIERHQVTLVHSVPSIFRGIVAQAGGLARMPSLALVFLAGEPLLPADVTAWQAAFGDRVALVNLYGPSETTMTKLFHRVTAADQREARVPIGTPMRGCAALLIDDYGQPAPAGTVGELYLRTPYRTLGYYRQPALTREVFVPNPFSDDPEDIVYETGDLARMRDDGAFEFLGRRDRQVKIHGVRIEPGDVENALRGCEGVLQAAVVAREDEPGDVRLCAYVVLRPEDAGASNGLGAVRDRLATQLPPHLLPSAFVALDRLPLTPHGKLDTQALPAPDVAAVTASREGQARTPVEEIVAGIWSQVLRRPSVGREEDFFALGGHSLLATQVMARLRGALDVELPLRALFDAPTVAGLAAIVDEHRRVQRVSGPPLRALPRDRPLPLSFAQQRIWFLTQLEPERATYNSPKAVRVRGPLSVAALRASLTDILRRHETLRTWFAIEDGQPVQAMRPPTAADWPVVDLGALPAPTRERAARRVMAMDARRPFDLTRGLLLRAHALRLAADEHVLLLTLHHIASDAWSLGILMRELSAGYTAALTHAAPHLPALPIQYADLVVWQRERLDEPVMARQLAFWREALHGLDTLALPTDHPRPARSDDRGARLTRTLSPIVVARAHEARRQQGVTLFMVLLATFDALLARYAGQTDIAVGTNIANRPHVDAEALIGCFVNQLVLRTNLGGDPSFAQLLARVRETTLGAYAHQDIPFEKLVEALAPARDLGRPPFFQVELLLQNVPRLGFELEGLQAAPFDAERIATKFDITLSFDEDEAGVHATLDYAVALHERESMARLLDHFERLLAGALEDVERPVTRVPLLGDAERAQLVREWNETTPSWSGETPVAVHLAVAAQAARTAEAIAIRHGAAQVSYRTVDAQANQLAHYLLAVGVGPDVCVGLCHARTPDLIVALLAILKAGGAYVPLEPSAPGVRLEAMLAQARAPIVVTDAASAAAFAGGTTMVVCLDADAPYIAAQPTDPPPVRVTPEMLAYVIYTSGSTGSPKGVMVTHGGLTNYLRWSLDAYDTAAGDGAPVHTSASVDLTVTSLLPPLLGGRALTLLPEADTLDALVAQARQGADFTLVKLTPSHLRALATLLPPERAATLTRRFVIGGEALSTRALAFWRTHAPDVRLVNEYGPTETVVGCCVHELSAREDDEREASRGGDLPIGRPIAHTQLYVLDPQGAPTPIGVAGELCIGGAGVARGYAHEPALTADRFVPDPFGATPGARLYRTGDRARWRRDGELEFLGRIDQQVKLRGFRIEPGEIEAALTTHADVRQCAVILRDDAGSSPDASSITAGHATDDARLVAYVVSTSGAPDIEALRAHLRTTLPEHMVPSLFVALDRLPMTASGKVDRRALPAPGAETRLAEDAAAPATAMEEIIAGVWCDVLRRDRIGRDEDFFALGGHSLLATSVIARLSAAFGLELPLRTVFEAPTIAAMAAAIESLRNGSAPPEEAGITRIDRARAAESGGLPLSFAQQRLWFLAQWDPASHAYNVPHAVRVTGRLRVDALRAAVATIAARHELLRARFPSRQGQPLVEIAPLAADTRAAVQRTGVPLLLIDLTGATAGAAHNATADALARRIAREEARQPFDLSRGPVWRICVLRVSDEDHVLLVTFHHIVSDGASVGIFINELTRLYRACCDGLDPRAVLPPLPVQYVDHAAMEQAWLRGERLQAQLRYWRAQLADLPVLELPTDHARPATPSGRGALLDVQLPASLAHGVRQASREAGVTMFMLLLAAWQLLLGRLAGQRDAAVGAPVLNRSRVETEGLIGLFANTLVLRTRWCGETTGDALLARVRETMLDAQAHQDLPFEKLVEQLAPTRDLSRSPLFQALIAYEQAAPETPSLAGTTAHPFERTHGAAKFDLSLALLDDWRRGTLSARIEYATDLVERVTIERVAARFTRLLSQLIDNRQARVDSLDLLDDAERAHLLTTVNATSTRLDDRSLPERVREQAMRTPDAIAIEAENGLLSYGELVRRADWLAARLRTHGVAAETRVAIGISRGVDLPVALLGVLASGGAYVPIDPGHPIDRLSSMLSNASVRAIVTDRREASRCAALAPRDCPLIVIDVIDVIDVSDDGSREASAGSLATGASRVCPAPHPAQAAYVMYTSGSTGQPKGVAVPHGALSNFLASMSTIVEMTASDRLVAVTTLGFDIAGAELYLPLLIGARLIVASRDTAQDGLALADLIDTRGATVLQGTPATWELLRAAGWRGSPALRVLCGGEALRPALADAFLAWGGPVWNLYGPTETTIWSLSARLSAARVAGGVPLGEPFANTQIYVMDDEGTLAPTGVAGELWIGGAGLARGYLRQAALTAERFVPDPFGAPGARAYRTGDRVRWRADGELAFLGRADHQVKLRGYRIEPGEIEAALQAHPDVRQSLVIRREDAPGNPRLVAYVLAAAGAACDASALRAHVRARVPEHMTPSDMVFLDAWPLTPNGKINRHALPAPSADSGGPSSDAIDGVESRAAAPRTPIEEIVAGIWASLLGRETIGRDEDFFGLGGHSLLATQVVARLPRAVGVTLPVRALFETPTVAGLAATIAAARETDREAVSTMPLARRADPRAPTPLSFAQQRLWFLHQLDPASAAYHVTTAVRLTGALRVGALDAALTEIVRRHDILRTSFLLHDGSPRPLVAPARPMRAPIVDLSICAAAHRERIWRRLAVAHATRPFDLARDPLLRIGLVRLDRDVHVLLLALHHIVSDGWSMAIAQRELAVLYSAACAGAPSPLPALPIQYADYAAWQRAALRDERLARHLEYWRGELDGTPTLDLPTDAPRPPIASTRGAAVTVTIPAELTRALRETSRAQQATLFMTLLAAFHLLLGRHAGQRDVAIGMPVAHRTEVETEGSIGCFANTLVARSRWQAREPFTELLRRVRETLLRAHAHQDLPFERLVDALAPARDLSRSPLFQVMLVFQHTARTESRMTALEVEACATEAPVSAFDLTLFMAEQGDALQARFVYASELFDAATVAQLARRWIALLTSVARDPASDVDTIDLLPPEERHHLLRQMNATQAPIPTAAVHAQVLARAAEMPEAIAIECEARHVTYAELSRRMIRVAAHLRSLGLRPEDTVAVSISRGPDLVIALLGVLAAGGAYVPIDATHPPVRLAHVLLHARVRWLIADAREHARLASAVPADCMVIAIEAIQAIAADEADEADEPRIGDADASRQTATILSSERTAVRPGSEQLAYVIYTSGSTGVPKGVAVSHGSLTNLLTSMAIDLGVTARDRLVAVTTISFDIAGLELYLPLCAGARLVIAPRDVVTAPDALADCLISRGASLMQATPAGWEQLCASGWRPPVDLRIVCGGEALRPALAETLLAGGGAVWNVYGPTETTIWSLTQRLRPEPVSRTPPIGAPIANTQIYVIDAAGELTPTGVPGELHIGGAGVARGYVHDPALTAARFVPDDFAPTAGARRYRTGDRVRYRADGSLEFLGRSDHQVKLHGHRIELGEIEAALDAHPLVRQSTVLLREADEGGPRLVAYIVSSNPEEQERPTPELLRAHLQERLPAYMMPSAYVLLEALALTPNGKIDRKALPAPDARAIADTVFVAPRTSTEQLLAEIWQQVLGLPRIGTRDNFFRLGGDSILSIKIIARANQAGLALAPRHIFEHQTIEELAAMAGPAAHPVDASPAIATAADLPEAAGSLAAR